MFPNRFERRLDHDLSDLQLIKRSETDIAPERPGGIRMDRQGCQRAFLAESLHLHVGKLKRGDRTDGQRTKMEIIPGAEKRAPLRPLGATVGEASQAGATRS
jgi:hypothetical protein